MKGLKRELEVEEGDNRSTEELVLELREVGKEVQLVDSPEGGGVAGGEAH